MCFILCLCGVSAVCAVILHTFIITSAQIDQLICMSAIFDPYHKVALHYTFLYIKISISIVFKLIYLHW